jgi:putative transposase
VHLAFVASYWRDALDQEMLTACERAMRGLCAEMDADLPELNSEPDHLHLLVLHRPRLRSPRSSTPQGVSPHHLRKEFTGRVSRHLIHGHLRSSSYLTASCGEAPTEIIKQYAEQQKQPDHTLTRFLRPSTSGNLRITSLIQRPAGAYGEKVPGDGPGDAVHCRRPP